MHSLCYLVKCIDNDPIPSIVIILIVLIPISIILIYAHYNNPLDDDWLYSGYGGIKGYKEDVEKGYTIPDSDDLKAIARYNKKNRIIDKKFKNKIKKKGAKVKNIFYLVLTIFLIEAIWMLPRIVEHYILK